MGYYRSEAMLQIIVFDVLLALKGCLEKYFIVPFEVAIDPLMATL